MMLIVMIATIYGYSNVNGTENNIVNMNWGAAGTPYLRLIPPDYIDGIGQPNGVKRANPRTISNQLLSKYQKLKNSDGMADMYAYFGQFLSHDLLLTNKNSSEMLTFQYPLCDAIFDSTCTNKTIPVARSTCQIPITDYRIEFSNQFYRWIQYLWFIFRKK